VTPAAHCCPREFTTIRRQHRPHEKIEEGSCSPPSTLDPFPQSVERSQPLLRSRAGIPTDEIGSGFNRLVQTVRFPHSQGIRSHHSLPTGSYVGGLRPSFTRQSLVRASDTGERPTPVARTGSVTPSGAHHSLPTEDYRPGLITTENGYLATALSVRPNVSSRVWAEVRTPPEGIGKEAPEGAPPPKPFPQVQLTSAVNCNPILRVSAEVPVPVAPGRTLAPAPETGRQDHHA